MLNNYRWLPDHSVKNIYVLYPVGSKWRRLERHQAEMKRYGGLWDKVISIDNLNLADDKARKGKSESYGVRVHDRHREENILRLHEALKSKTFRTSSYDVFTIHEPKERVIYRLPYYPDRIVHHAVMNVLEPIFVRTFTHNTFSCIKGRGIEGCARFVDKTIRKYEGRPLYVLKIDIRKFYPSVKHDVLKTLLRRKIKDKDLLWLLDEIIDSAEGIPIGNYLSQYFANFYLCYLMHRINEVLRLDASEYADDIVVFADNKEDLHKALDFIRVQVKKLKLELKGNYQTFPIAVNRYDKHGRALDYVGYKFCREQKLIRKTIKQNLCRKAKKIKTRDPKAIRMALAPWLGWLKHSNSINLKRKIYETILNQQADTAGA